MGNCWPQLPVQSGVQSNCWKFMTMDLIVQHVINIINYLAAGAGGSVVQELINLFLTITYQYHSLYYIIEITEEWWRCLLHKSSESKIWNTCFKRRTKYC